jgi:hypothetical protein
MPREDLTGNNGFNGWVASGVRAHLPSRVGLAGSQQDRRRGGGGNLGVRRTMAARSSLLGPVVAEVAGLAWVTDRGPSCRHNEALKLSRRFAPRSLTPVRYAARRPHWEWRFQLVRSFRRPASLGLRSGFCLLWAGSVGVEVGVISGCAGRCRCEAA